MSYSQVARGTTGLVVAGETIEPARRAQSSSPQILHSRTGSPAEPVSGIEVGIARTGASHERKDNIIEDHTKAEASIIIAIVININRIAITAVLLQGERETRIRVDLEVYFGQTEDKILIDEGMTIGQVVATACRIVPNETSHEAILHIVHFHGCPINEDGQESHADVGQVARVPEVELVGCVCFILVPY